VDGITHDGVPLPNVLVDELKKSNALPLGRPIIWPTPAKQGAGPQEIAEGVARGEMDICRMPRAPYDEIKGKAYEMARPAVERIAQNRQTREKMIEELGEGEQPYLYVIVATRQYI